MAKVVAMVGVASINGQGGGGHQGVIVFHIKFEYGQVEFESSQFEIKDFNIKFESSQFYILNKSVLFVLAMYFLPIINDNERLDSA